MRVWTSKAFVDNNINKADNLNEDQKGVLEVLNGALDHHNLPMESFEEAELQDTTIYSYNSTTGTEGPVNSYYRCGPRTSSLEFDPLNGDVFQGWNLIETDFILEFQAVEGMLKGSAVVAGYKYATYYTSGGLSTEVGTDSFWELAVFCNGVMIAHSGGIPVGVSTVDLAFATPIGNEFVTIEARWRVNNPYDNRAWDYPSLSIVERDLWCRNEKR